MLTERSRAPQEIYPLIGLCVFLLALLFLGGVAKIVFSSVLLSYILVPIVNALESRGLGRGVATLILLCVIVGAIVAAGFLLVPLILEQIRTLQTGVASAKATAAIRQLQEAIREPLVPIGLGDIDLFEKVEHAKRSIGQKALDFLVNDSLHAAVAMVATPFMMFFLIKDGRDLRKRFIELVPNRYFEFVMDLLYKMEVQLGNFLRSQFADALAFGILATIALWILGVPYFLFIGTFAGIANLIPYVGPLVGALPGFVAAVMTSGKIASGLYVLVAFALLKILDDFLIQPFLVSRGVGLHPLFVLIAIMIGGGLFGVLGMLLATPVAGFLKVAFCESLSTLRKYRFG
jgi:putative permease